MLQTEKCINYFASNLRMLAKTQISLCKKRKLNLSDELHVYRNFDKQVFHQGKSILPFKRPICAIIL